jgi:hypothetical protein
LDGPGPLADFYLKLSKGQATSHVQSFKGCRFDCWSAPHRLYYRLQWEDSETLVSCTTLSQRGEGTADATPNNIAMNDKTERMPNVSFILFIYFH